MAKGNDSGDGPPPSGKPPRGRSYDWLVRGGETWQELTGEVEGEAAAPAAGVPEPSASKLSPAAARWLENPSTGNGPGSGDDRGESIEVVVAGRAPLSAAGKPGLGPLGTAILPDSGQPSPADDPVVEITGEQEGPSGVVAGGTAFLPESHPGLPVPQSSVPPTAVPPTARSGSIQPPPPPPPRKTTPPPMAPAKAAPAPTPSWAPESRIGQYEIIRELGSGGMGVVYLARDERLARQVAIKFLRTGNQELTRRFLIEARATARASHENIVVIHEVGEAQGSPYMVLEYLRGQTLSALLKKSGPLPPTRAVEIIVSVVRALAHAHEQEIVHRDLKPENIFITDSGTVKVLDFGIAKVLRDEPGGAAAVRPLAPGVGGGNLKAPQHSGIIGTMAYMSPEQWGLGAVDVRTDIWAVGVILYLMLTGAHPLDAFEPDPFGFVMQLDKPMPSIREAIPSLPGELAQVVDSCLRKKHAERLGDATTLLRALEPFMPGRFAARPGHQQIESGPYAGLRSFQEEDAGRFFGRGREIAELATRIQESPLMAVVGPSGVGKSSFVRAGVVPTLKESGEKWEAMVTRPGLDPVLALASLLAPIVGSSTTVGDDLGAQKELAARLVKEPGLFGSALRSKARRDGHRLLLFLDQFEELYTLCADPAARRAFTTCLAAAADDATSPVRVVLSIRGDFLGRVAEDPHFMNELTRGLFFLGPPSQEGLREAVIQPAENEGYRFESPAMVDEMLKYLESTPGALPLLQFTAAQLWEARDPRRKLLTKQSYDALGGIAGALVSHADKVVAKLQPEVQVLARWLFPHLVTPERTRAVREIGELREIAPNQADLQRLIDHLVDARLLVVQTAGGGATTLEIVHESLITTWPALRRWLDESHEESVFLDQLWAAARQWQAQKRSRGLLWTGDVVDELAAFKRRYKGELPEVVRAFSDAVFEQKTRGARRRRTLVTIGVTGLVIVAAVLAGATVFATNAKMAAVRNEAAAKQAEGEAQRRLQEVVAKERERREAEAKQKVAEKQVTIANTKVEKTNEELQKANEDLQGALGKAKEQKERAEELQKTAEANEWAAKEAKKDAENANEQLKTALAKEKARADRLKERLGTLVESLQ